MNDEIDGLELEFPFGLLGFETYKHFTIEKCEYKPFYWLQSVEDRSLSFLIVDPFIFFNDFEIDVDDDTLKLIDLDSPTDVMVMTIITIPGGGNSLTANLQGPLVINRKNNKAMQVILSNPEYTTKHPISAESLKGGSKC